MAAQSITVSPKGNLHVSGYQKPISAIARSSTSPRVVPDSSPSPSKRERKTRFQDSPILNYNMSVSPTGTNRALTPLFQQLLTNTSDETQLQRNTIPRRKGQKYIRQRVNDSSFQKLERSNTVSGRFTAGDGATTSLPTLDAPTGHTPREHTLPYVTTNKGSVLDVEKLDRERLSPSYSKQARYSGRNFITDPKLPSLDRTPEPFQPLPRLAHQTGKDDRRHKGHLAVDHNTDRSISPSRISKNRDKSRSPMKVNQDNTLPWSPRKREKTFHGITNVTKKENRGVALVTLPARSDRAVSIPCLTFGTKHSSKDAEDVLSSIECNHDSEKHRNISISSEPTVDVIEALRAQLDKRIHASHEHGMQGQGHPKRAATDAASSLSSRRPREIIKHGPRDLEIFIAPPGETRPPSASLWEETEAGGTGVRRIQKMPISLRLARLNHNVLEQGPLPIAVFKAYTYLPPLLRFKKAVRTIITLLKATTSGRRPDQTRVQQEKVLSFTQFKDELIHTTSSYGDGLDFDKLAFKAQRENQLSSEAKSILTLEQADRTDEQQHLALVGLNQAVDSFSEFPIKMQKSLVRVGWYENFEAKRVIIRQGHTADNFYFILSGQALVTILQTDKQGESRANTVACLGKGNSFGELALMHGATRSATVTCKDDVELLAVGREDFIDIFMHVEKNSEPEHIQFLRHIDVLRDWPIDRLPWDDPKICLFTYFRRGVVMCRDSNKADWVYIIKTGSCRVLKHLQAAAPNVMGLERQDYSQLDPNTKTLVPPTSTARLRAPKDETTGYLQLQESPGVTPRREDQAAPADHRIPRVGDISYGKGLPPIRARKKEEVEAELEEHKQAIDKIYKSKHESSSNVGPGKKRVQFADELDQNPVKPEDPPKPQIVFVQLQKLGPKETFGLEYVAFSLMERCTSVSLVSDGAEAILISKKFFLQHLTDDVRKHLRTTIQPYPSEESLQQKLQDKSNWEAYKTMMINDHVIYNKYVHDTLYY